VRAYPWVVVFDAVRRVALHAGTRVAWVLSVWIVGCSSNNATPGTSSPDAGTPTNASGGTGATSVTDGASPCTPDDRQADPPCALGEQMRCNGKCFSTPGECKAGCRYMGKAWYPAGYVFENGMAYGYEAGNIVRVNLDTYESKTYSTPGSASFSRMVVYAGNVYFSDGAWLDVADETGASQQWVQLPQTIDQLAQVSGTIFALNVLNRQLYSIAIAQPTPVTAASSVYGIAYDETYLYESAAPSGSSTSVYRATVDQVASPTYVTNLLGVGQGQNLGDYLYSATAGSGGFTYIRVPKGGGPSETVATVTTMYQSTAAGTGVMFALDADGQVWRVAPGSAGQVIATVDANAAQVIASDGKWAYVATTGNSDGALFRILAQ
jgi:hypothetical protein